MKEINSLSSLCEVMFNQVTDLKPCSMHEKIPKILAIKDVAH